MFSFFNKNNPQVLSPLTGECVAISDVPDPVFSDKILGDGVAIIPQNGIAVAPVDGEILQIAHTHHAIGIKTDDGLELLVHLGIDTVKLNKEGFKVVVEVGQKVKCGDKLIEMDIPLIESKGFKVITPCVVTNMDEVKTFSPVYGKVTAGETAVLTYKMK